MRIGHKFRLLVWVFLCLHVGVDHADSDSRQGQDNSQYLPGLCCETQAVTEAQFRESGTISAPRFHGVFVREGGRLWCRLAAALQLMFNERPEKRLSQLSLCF